MPVSFSRFLGRFPGVMVLCLGLAGGRTAADPLPLDIQDKTLVAWVATDDPTVGGGSALTIGREDLFDGLIFGERVPKKWTAGSDFWHRTPPDAGLSNESDVPPGQLVQVALVHQGTSATLYRDGQAVASWTLEKAPPLYDNGAYIIFGRRNNDAQGKAYFSGVIDDARVYDYALTAAQIAALKPKVMGEERPVAWWDFAKDATDRMGSFTKIQLYGNARVEGGQLHLHGAGDYVECFDPQAAIARIQFRPSQGRFADPIPFFWKGHYHIFYLQGGVGKVPWQHIVSTNLVDWKQLPTALVSDGAPDSWDGGNMFTGSVIEHHGHFFCFYTGDNGANPIAHEGVRLALSDDLITWKKQPDFLLLPDGKTYVTKAGFRDPFPYKMPGPDEWWMILYAENAQHGPGVYTSTDLQHWTPAPPLAALLQECPDLFKIGDTFYLTGADHYASGKDLRGPFPRTIQGFIDRPGIYAGKRMFDGKRHVWVGWISDTENLKDDGKLTWGGTMCTPRELTAGPNGQLNVRPVQEVIDAYSRKVLDLASAQPEFDPAQWETKDGILTSKAAPAQACWAIPNEGMLTMKINLSPDAKVTVAFHCDPAKNQGGYEFRFSPADTKVITCGQSINWVREDCHIPANQTLILRAILIGTTIEFFINDEYAFTRRAYDLKDGKLGLKLDAGTATVQDIQFSQLPQVATQP